MAQMIKPVLLISGVRGDTRRYRLFHLKEQLNLLGVEAQAAHISEAGLSGRLQQAGMVLFQRVSWNPWVEKLVEDLKRQGTPLLTDVDDLVFDSSAFAWIDSPDFADPVRTRLYLEEIVRNRQTLQASHGILVSTDYLAGQARDLGRPVRVHRNAFSLEMLALSDSAYLAKPAGSAEKIVIGYASGTLTHNKDFALIRPALQTVLARFKQVELWLVGPLDPGADWGELESRIRRIPLVPWRSLPAIQAQFDINLAPLRIDNPFGQSKSELKYIEGALTRCPTIASPSAAFRTAIQPGKNGFLADSAETWIEHLSALITQPSLRKSVGEQAYQDVLVRYHPRRRAEDLALILSEFGLPSPPTAAASIRPLDPEIENHPSLIQMGLYNLRSRGLGILIMQIWVYIRRLLSPVFPYRRHE